MKKPIFFIRKPYLLTLEEEIEEVKWRILEYLYYKKNLISEKEIQEEIFYETKYFKRALDDLENTGLIEKKENKYQITIEGIKKHDIIRSFIKDILKGEEIIKSESGDISKKEKLKTGTYIIIKKDKNE